MSGLVFGEPSPVRDTNLQIVLVFGGPSIGLPSLFTYGLDTKNFIKDWGKVIP